MRQIPFLIVPYGFSPGGCCIIFLPLLHCIYPDIGCAVCEEIIRLMRIIRQVKQMSLLKRKRRWRKFFGMIGFKRTLLCEVIFYDVSSFVWISFYPILYIEFLKSCHNGFSVHTDNLSNLPRSG